MDMVVYQIRYRKFCSKKKRNSVALTNKIWVFNGHRLNTNEGTVTIPQIRERRTQTKLTLSVRTTPSFQVWYLVSMELSLFTTKQK